MGRTGTGARVIAVPKRIENVHAPSPLRNMPVTCFQALEA